MYENVFENFTSKALAYFIIYDRRRKNWYLGLATPSTTPRPLAVIILVFISSVSVSPCPPPFPGTSFSECKLRKEIYLVKNFLKLSLTRIWLEVIRPSGTNVVFLSWWFICARVLRLWEFYKKEKEEKKEKKSSKKWKSKSFTTVWKRFGEGCVFNNMGTLKSYLGRQIFEVVKFT